MARKKQNDTEIVKKCVEALDIFVEAAKKYEPVDCPVMPETTKVQLKDFFDSRGVDVDT